MRRIAIISVSTIFGMFLFGVIGWCTIHIMRVLRRGKTTLYPLYISVPRLFIIIYGGGFILSDVFGDTLFMGICSFKCPSMYYF